MPTRILLTIICFALLASGCATTPAPELPAAPTPEEAETNLASFEEFWTTIRDSHWREDMGGVDWQAVHDEFDSTVVAGVTRQQLRPILQEMISRLGVSHYDIIASDVYDDLPDAESEEASTGKTGITLRVIDGRAMVFRVREGSAAAEAEVLPGWIVESIDGEDLDAVLEKVAASQKGRTIDRYMLWRSAQMRLGGSVDEPAEIVFIDGDEKRRSLEIERRPPEGPVSQFGNMMPLRMRSESRRLPGDIGYFTFSVFADAPRLMKHWNEAMDGFADCRGMIVDLRGNPGGIGILACGMAGSFVGESGHDLGTMIMRTSELRFAVNRKPRPFTGPVAVLIDELSASTAEIMAAGLRDIGHGRLFGMLTAGAALPSYFKRLPNDDVLQYAVAMFTTPGGDEIEGFGIAPDDEIPLSRGALLAGNDPVLDAALAWLKANDDKGDTE